VLDDDEGELGAAVALDDVEELGAALLDVAGDDVEEEFDGAAAGGDVTVLLDEETCGAEGVAVGVGESA
jgi:hypothetical protein